MSHSVMTVSPEDEKWDINFAQASLITKNKEVLASPPGSQPRSIFFFNVDAKSLSRPINQNLWDGWEVG